MFMECVIYIPVVPYIDKDVKAKVIPTKVDFEFNNFSPN